MTTWFSDESKIKVKILTLIFDSSENFVVNSTPWAIIAIIVPNMIYPRTKNKTTQNKQKKEKMKEDFMLRGIRK